MSFNYDNMPSTTAYTSIPVSKAPYFDELVITNGRIA
jgi:hypothetical protein